MGALLVAIVLWLPQHYFRAMGMLLVSALIFVTIRRAIYELMVCRPFSMKLYEEDRTGVQLEAQLYNAASWNRAEGARGRYGLHVSRASCTGPLRDS